MFYRVSFVISHLSAIFDKFTIFNFSSISAYGRLDKLYSFSTNFKIAFGPGQYK